jgi:hypothetical protein
MQARQTTPLNAMPWKMPDSSCQPGRSGSASVGIDKQHLTLLKAGANVGDIKDPVLTYEVY